MTGDELRALRDRAGWTQQELADRVGVAKNTVWRWESEQRPIPEPVARLVALLAGAERKKRRR